MRTTDLVLRGKSVIVPTLIYWAYGIESWRIIGLPDWAKSERFDLSVTYKDTSSLRDAVQRWSVSAERSQALREPVQVALAEIFQLRGSVRRVETAVYALVPVRGLRPSVAGLRSSEADCQMGEADTRSSSVDEQQAIHRRFCGVELAAGELRSGGITMKDLATELEGQIGGWVVDETQLTGRYEFQLQHPDVKPKGPFGPFVRDIPSLKAALERQLSLTLERRRSFVDALVIDDVRRPRLGR